MIAWSLSLYVIDAQYIFGDGRKKGRDREKKEGKRRGRKISLCQAVSSSLGIATVPDTHRDYNSDRITL